MNHAPEFVAKREEWADALLSGKFKQGHSTLRPTNEEYCCLGVACTLLPGRWVNSSDPEDLAMGYDPSWSWHPDPDVFSGGYLHNNLSREQNEILGISNAESNGLASANDEGASFAEIAWAITGTDEELHTFLRQYDKDFEEVAA